MGVREDAKKAFLRGMKEFNFGDKDKALALFEDSIELFDLADGWLGKGMVLGERGQTEEAMAAFNRALNARPGYARAWWHKGMLFKEIGEMERALEAYDHAMVGDFGEDDVLRPTIEQERAELFAEIWSSRGKELLGAGSHLKALELFEQANSKYGAHPRLLLGMSLALFQLGRQKEAVSRLIDAWQTRDRTTDVNLVATIENGLRSFGIETGER